MHRVEFLRSNERCNGLSCRGSLKITSRRVIRRPVVKRKEVSGYVQETN